MWTRAEVDLEGRMRAEIVRLRFFNVVKFVWPLLIFILEKSWSAHFWMCPLYHTALLDSSLVVAPQWAGMVWEWAENDEISGRLPAILPKLWNNGGDIFEFSDFFAGFQIWHMKKYNLIIHELFSRSIEFIRAMGWAMLGFRCFYET